jgi:hypothetical protein
MWREAVGPLLLLVILILLRWPKPDGRSKIRIRITSRSGKAAWVQETEMHG